jgi:hypothetical protein
MNVIEFRKKHPQYDDMSDMELSSRLHKKHYSDMSFDDFRSRFGVEAPVEPQATERPAPTDLRPSVSTLAVPKPSPFAEPGPGQENVRGALEAGAALATGIPTFVAGQTARIPDIVGRVAAGAKPTEAFLDSREIAEKIGGLGYQPRTEEGQVLTETLMKPIEIAREKAIPWALTPPTPEEKAQRGIRERYPIQNISAETPPTMDSRNIVTPKESGKSELITVAGRKGRFNFDKPPQYIEGVGGGETPLYSFETEDGQEFHFRLERDKQGGRWEEGKYFSEELDEIRANPSVAYKFWGNTPLANYLVKSTVKGLDDKEIKEGLKQFNTNRQISGDEQLTPEEARKVELGQSAFDMALGLSPLLKGALRAKPSPKARVRAPEKPTEALKPEKGPSALGKTPETTAKGLFKKSMIDKIRTNKKADVQLGTVGDILAEKKIREQFSDVLDVPIIGQQGMPGIGGRASRNRRTGKITIEVPTYVNTEAIMHEIIHVKGLLEEEESILQKGLVNQRKQSLK